MAAPGRLNLRWDGFEANRRVELEEFRTQSGFCDVSLVASDGRRVRANQVILANGSSFFCKILTENSQPDHLIYLTGVIYGDLLSLLDFLYTGEVSIVQKALSQFLNIAEHLEIKSLPSSHQGQMAAQELSSSSRESFHRGMTLSAGIKPKEEVMDCDKDMFLIESVGSALGNKELIHDKLGEENDSMILARKRDIELDKNNSMKNCGVKEEVVDSNCELVNHDWYEQGEENEDEIMIEDGDEIFSFGRKYFQCCHCTKMFFSASHLKLHKRSHTGEKPFQCPICFKNFSLAGNLTRHRKLHTGEKLYQCPICSKKFNQLTNLNSHLRRKTKCSPKL